MSDRNRISPEASGFSLIEVMIVIFVMGMASTVIVLTAPKPESVIEVDARRLKQAIEDLQVHAVMRGRGEGLYVDETGVAPVYADAGKWIAEQSSLLSFSRGVRINSGRHSHTDQPDFMADATGMLFPATLRMSSGRQVINVIVTPEGHVRLDSEGN